jgi:hypothetical protein
MHSNLMGLGVAYVVRPAPGLKSVFPFYEGVAGGGVALSNL